MQLIAKLWIFRTSHSPCSVCWKESEKYQDHDSFPSVPPLLWDEMEMPLLWVQTLCCAPKGKSGLLRIGQDSHLEENSLGRFAVPCYHSWLSDISLSPGMGRAEVLVVWKRAELSPVGSGGSHTALALEALQGDNAVTE